MCLSIKNNFLSQNYRVRHVFEQKFIIKDGMFGRNIDLREYDQRGIEFFISMYRK